jgi:poly-gamma-glutamate synthesis protein (capsule biosynthesis protein)
VRGGRAPLGALLATAAVLTLGCGSDPRSSAGPPADLPASGPIVLALTGDSFMTSPVLEGNEGTRHLLDVVRRATLGFTNLESVWLDRERATAAEARPLPRWPFGPDTLGRPLRDLGFDVVSLANNRTMALGPDGLRSTVASLDHAAIRHPGAGNDLAEARAPVYVGSGARRVAWIAVTASAAPDAGASASQTDIRGRPGVNRLGYAAHITADPATFDVLKQSVVPLNAGPPPGEREFTMFGTRIVRGDHTRVDFVMDQEDERAILETIRTARGRAEIVVVSLHAHEPSNASETPADFVRRFAHDAADAGATLIVGHGPHRLREAEVYNGVPILYSLGNFIYPPAGPDFRAADEFDAGRDLLTAALGAVAAPGSPAAQLESPWWWESVLAIVTAEPGGRLSLRFYPVDLAGDGAAADRGRPRLAAGERGSALLRRFSASLKGGHPSFLQEDARPVLDWSIP